MPWGVDRLDNGQSALRRILEHRSERPTRQRDRGLVVRLGYRQSIIAKRDLYRFSTCPKTIGVNVAGPSGSGSCPPGALGSNS